MAVAVVALPSAMPAFLSTRCVACEHMESNRGLCGAKISGRRQHDASRQECGATPVGAKPTVAQQIAPQHARHAQRAQHAARRGCIGPSAAPLGASIRLGLAPCRGLPRWLRSKWTTTAARCCLAQRSCSTRLQGGERRGGVAAVRASGAAAAEERTGRDVLEGQGAAAVRKEPKTRHDLLGSRTAGQHPPNHIIATKARISSQSSSGRRSCGTSADVNAGPLHPVTSLPSKVLAARRLRRKAPLHWE